jgi:hypothetical protein
MEQRAFREFFLNGFAVDIEIALLGLDEYLVSADKTSKLK